MGRPRRTGRTAKVVVGVGLGLAISAVAAAVLPGFLVVRSSPCVRNLKAIATAQQSLYLDRNSYTASFADLVDLVLDPNSPYSYALDAGHPSGVMVDCAGCQFVATCRSDLPNRDVWSIASVERSVRGETVQAFFPFHDLNGE